MATYEEIYGKRVKEFDSDPTLDSSYEGQVWYDKATGTLRTVTASIAAWSSGPSRSTTAGGPAVFGQINTAAVACAGSNPPGTGLTATENYNGTGWTTSGAANTARYAAAAIGSQTAGLLFAGATPPVISSSEEYDGSSWTSGNSLNTARSSIQGFGLQTAGVACGGTGPLGNNTTNATEEYDGTSWTAVTAMPLGNREFAASGIQTAGIATGGNSSADTTDDISVDYDGTNWTANSNLPVGASSFGGFGSADDAYVIGGGSTTMYEWNGTSWATPGANTANNASSRIVANGTPSSSLFNGPSTTTEEYNRSINTITAASWSSGGNINDARRAFGSCGSNTAGLIFGGRLSPTASPPAAYRGRTEQYDGTSWTEVSDLNNTRSNLAGAGTQAAAVAFGGLNPALGPRPADNVEEWDGSSWTNVTDVPTGSENYGSCGIQTAALQYGGSAPPGVLTTTLEYDGTNWTSGGAMNTARKLYNGSGTQTAALGAGGQEPSLSSKTEEYDGTSWSEVNNMNRAAFYSCSTSAPQTDSMSFGSGPSVNYVEKYDGTIWSTAPTLATSRSDGSGFGTSANGSVMVGGPSGPTTYPSATEEFTGVTETVTASTLTSS